MTEMVIQKRSAPRRRWYACGYPDTSNSKGAPGTRDTLAFKVINADNKKKEITKKYIHWFVQTNNSKLYNSTRFEIWRQEHTVKGSMQR